MRRFLLPLVMVVLALGLVAWNASRFIGAEARIRTKELSFLPSPAVGRVLALGHTNTAAKLRWIDSFAYFQLQLDRKDDRIAGTGESAFVRLYDLLVSLDGRFLPFYEHGVLTLGGIQTRSMESLRLIQRGILELPGDPQLWRLLAVELYSSYRWEERQPQAFDAVLNAWHAAMTDPQQAQQVWDWKIAFGRRREPGLDQVPYWMAQYGSAQGPAREFILQTIRDQIARYGEDRLSSLVKRHRDLRGTPPLALTELLSDQAIRAEWPQGVPQLAPVERTVGGWVLRADPFGWPYRLTAEGTVASDGALIHRFGRLVQKARVSFEASAKSSGRWPEDLAAVRAAGVDLPEPPVGGTWILTGQDLDVTWPKPPAAPWQP